MNQPLGKIGEEKACEYLVSQGYEILANNYRHKRNEIDIIAAKDQTLVFVEVKAKSYNAFGNPEDAVDEKKASRIIEAADHYIFENNWQKNIRFDVIAIEEDKGRYAIAHFKDAFY